tara:strand:+ start:371 stop:493 length:123 start_codon:yes stop_codon:yes gene_type:complete
MFRIPKYGASGALIKLGFHAKVFHCCFGLWYLMRVYSSTI